MTSSEQAPPAPVEQVEWRPQGKPRDNRCQFVPYLNAATVAGLLDGWVGPDGWEDFYEVGQVAGTEVVWCRLTVHFEDRPVTKMDLGKPSNFEGEKGAVSDAFKRAATLKFGVGRNVYDLPIVWAPCRTDSKGNPWPSDETLPAIRRELEKRGVDGAAAQRTGVDDGHHPEPDDSPEPPSEPSSNGEPMDDLTALRERIRKAAKKHKLVAAMAGYLADTYQTNSLDDLDQPQLLEIAADLHSATGRAKVGEYGEAA